MNEELNERYFDLACRILNYAIEFENAPGYSSLRFVDTLKELIDLQPLITELSNEDFYEKIRDKIKSRELLADPETKSKFLEGLLTMFIDEWNKSN